MSREQLEIFQKRKTLRNHIQKIVIVEESKDTINFNIFFLSQTQSGDSLFSTFQMFFIFKKV